MLNKLMYVCWIEIIIIIMWSHQIIYGHIIIIKKQSNFQLTLVSGFLRIFLFAAGTDTAGTTAFIIFGCSCCCCDADGSWWGLVECCCCCCCCWEDDDDDDDCCSGSAGGSPPNPKLLLGPPRTMAGDGTAENCGCDDDDWDDDCESWVWTSQWSGRGSSHGPSLQMGRKKGRKGHTLVKFSESCNHFFVGLCEGN